MKGIVDRFEGDLIVVELDNGKMVNIGKSKVPFAQEGDILIISGESITIDKEGTEERKKKMEEKLKKLFE